MQPIAFLSEHARVYTAMSVTRGVIGQTGRGGRGHRIRSHPRSGPQGLTMRGTTTQVSSSLRYISFLACSLSSYTLRLPNTIRTGWLSDFDALANQAAARVSVRGESSHSNSPASRHQPGTVSTCQCSWFHLCIFLVVKSNLVFLRVSLRSARSLWKQTGLQIRLLEAGFLGRC